MIGLTQFLFWMLVCSICFGMWATPYRKVRDAFIRWIARNLSEVQS